MGDTRFKSGVPSWWGSCCFLKDGDASRWKEDSEQEEVCMETGKNWVRLETLEEPAALGGGAELTEGGRDSIHHGWLWMGGKVQPRWLQHGRGEGGRPDGKRRGRAPAVGAQRAGPAGDLHRIPRLAVLRPTPELTDDFLQKQAVFVALEKGPPVRGPHSHPGRPSLLSTTTHNHRSCQWKPLCPSELVCLPLHARAHTHTQSSVLIREVNSVSI